MIKLSIKAILCFFSCLALVACNNSGNTEAVGFHKDTLVKTILQNKGRDSILLPNSVANIKRLYTFTRNLSNVGKLDSVYYDYDCQNERSGKVVYFFHNDKVIMISHTYNEYDHFEATDRYFVHDGKLYFALLNRLVWSFESEGVTKDDITETRNYVVNDRLVLCLEKKYTIRQNAAGNPKAEDVPNKTVDRNSIKELQKGFAQLVEFKDKANHSCLEEH